MGKNTLSRDTYTSVSDRATRGGTRSATNDAEERVRQGRGLDPLVDPKGPAHLGPIRRSLPRFDKQGDFWLLTRGIPMAEETLLDTTGSMGENVDIAFKVLPHSYEMLTSGSRPIMSRYDPQIASAIFNDVDDGPNVPVLCRTQFEMDEKIALQMTRLVPGRNGCGNGKEDSQFGLFAAAYFTAAAINQYGLKYYHFTVSDEPTVDTINLSWLKRIFGEDVLEHIKANGFDFTAKDLPDTAKVVTDLQARAHAFFLQVGDRSDVKRQWLDLYGADHFVMLPGGGTHHLHYVKAIICGLTEGVLDLNTAAEFLQEHKIPASDAKRIVRAVAHIPLGAQTLFPNFDKLPKAGDLFSSKTDLWPTDKNAIPDDTKPETKGGPSWL